MSTERDRSSVKADEVWVETLKVFQTSAKARLSQFKPDTWQYNQAKAALEEEEKALFSELSKTGIERFIGGKK